MGRQHTAAGKHCQQQADCRACADHSRTGAGSHLRLCAFCIRQQGVAAKRECGWQEQQPRCWCKQQGFTPCQRAHLTFRQQVRKHRGVLVA